MNKQLLQDCLQEVYNMQRYGHTNQRLVNRLIAEINKPTPEPFGVLTLQGRTLSMHLNSTCSNLLELGDGEYPVYLLNPKEGS